MHTGDLHSEPEAPNKLFWSGCRLGNAASEAALAEASFIEVFLMATPYGLCRITWPEEGFPALLAWRDKHMPGALLVQDEERLLPYTKQLQEYFDGVRREFTLPLDLRGTTFQQSVWRALCQIPYGSTISYSGLAEQAGRPGAARAAGAANGSNPLPLLVPCHRAIGKSGALTGFRGGLAVKETLLRLEGAIE